MQKIIIKNFGPIQEAEIELKKVLVLIGEQASGKSTIAKLIYFFKTLREDLFSKIYQADSEIFNKTKDFSLPIKRKFRDFFGPNHNLPMFEIRFYYHIEKNKYVHIEKKTNTSLVSVTTHNLLDKGFANSINEIKKFLLQGNNINGIDDQLFYDQKKIVYVRKLSILIKSLFESNQTDSLFVIAGRNATVNYSDLFEKYLFASVQNRLEEDDTSMQNIEETLMLKFIEKVVKIKDIFKKEGNIDGLIAIQKEDKEVKNKLNKIKRQIRKILKGTYIIDDSGEKIILNSRTKNFIHISNASSGQQEVLRILQDIFLLILRNTKSFRIIEEPEAHLFPVAQKHLIELLAYMVNHDEDNQLIITTHSPYMLTIFNNLLFANRVVEKNVAAESGVNEIIEKAFWLKASDFSAYSLGNSSFGEDAAYCESIFNEKTGMIQQNYLDDVSEMLGSDFQALMNIHAKTFAR